VHTLAAQACCCVLTMQRLHCLCWPGPSVIDVKKHRRTLVGAPSVIDVRKHRNALVGAELHCGWLHSPVLRVCAGINDFDTDFDSVLPQSLQADRLSSVFMYMAICPSCGPHVGAEPDVVTQTTTQVEA
jgi:hypothetical protein